MVVCESNINNIMGGLETPGGVTLHNHRRKLKQRFDIIRKLGQGTYGKVQLGINKETGQEVAIKTIKKCKIDTEADLVRIRREIQIMSSVQHPNIIHIYEVFENREKMVLVMEYAAGGELYDYLSERKVLTEDEARRIFRQIATAVYYCHKHKICHRDLKLENILLDEHGSAKIADFGLSNVFDDRRLLSTFCGSPLYASPEIVKGTPYHGPEVDCWSLGVLLYTLVYGAMPFDGSNFKRLVKQISQGDYFEPKKPSSASLLIREMLTVAPEKRASVENICKHWWVNATYTESCFEIAEDLANQTPVRLDLLLSLAPPPPPVGGDQNIIAGESSVPPPEAYTPARSQSVGSLMELAPPAERRIRELVTSEDQKSPKRKLELTVSTEHVAKRKEKPPALVKNSTQTVVHEELKENDSDPSLQGAACCALLEESKKNEAKKKVVKKKPEQETEQKDKENDENTKIPVKRKVTKKVLTDKSTNIPKPETKKPEEETPEEPSKPIVRRQSKIFETAEKFQNLQNETKTSAEKPKKIFIPGVNVGGFKKEFERKASLTTTSVPDLKKIKKTATSASIDKPKPEEEKLPSETQRLASETRQIAAAPQRPQQQQASETQQQAVTPQQPELPSNKAFIERKKTAVDIISNAITKDGARKSKSRPCVPRKPPVPFGINGRSASGSINFSTVSKQPEVPDDPSKSATLPRRKTTKAEIHLDYPPPRPATMEFKTEVAHRIEKPELKTQKSEILVPVNNGVSSRIRSTSLDPEIKPRKAETPKERIIPISFERDDKNKRPEVTSPQAKPPMPKAFQTQRPAQPQRFGSHDSEAEATMSETLEPIRKSPREYIIPIAVEGGGYVTPRANSLEPSDTGSGISSRRSMPRFGRNRKLLENGSEEDLSFSSLHRHNSIGRDSDIEEPFHMHRLRSSRPTRKINLEHADSLSSGEEDDDDGFEILTAENLFSTLLSRVRSLTQRLNVEDNGRLFPNTRLLGNFDHGSKLFNLHNDSISRFSPGSTGAPWRRSVSRDLASDIERVFSAGGGPPGASGAPTTLPRDKAKKSIKEAKFDLSGLKLTDEDTIALSYLTPGLSRRIQHQLMSQMPTSKKDKLKSDTDEYNFARPPPKLNSFVAEIPNLQEKSHVEPKPLNIYRLEDIKKEYSIDNNKYTPFKSCFRSTSLVEPASSSFKSQPYYRSTNFSSDNFDSNKYSAPNYYDTCLFNKERKKRELETQKVLKEIRNKRINEFKTRQNNNSEVSQVTSHINDNSTNPAVEKVAEKNMKRDKSSKLIRPKSYPTACNKETKKPDKKQKKTSADIEKSDKSSPVQEIEKKIRNFCSETAQKNANSRIKSTIKSLRERSEPKHVEHCVTESGLIKRAVSSEDFSVFGLQPSRKSVTKILGLFKKIEDKKSSTSSKLKSKLPIRGQSVEPDLIPERNNTEHACNNTNNTDITEHACNIQTQLFSPDDSDCSASSDLKQLSPNENKTLSEDENESVSDRIRRKSFYCRFNEKKKTRNASLDLNSAKNSKYYRRAMSNDNYCYSETPVDYSAIKPKRSLLKTPMKIRNRTMSPPSEDLDRYGPSTSSHRKTNDISI